LSFTILARQKNNFIPRQLKGQGAQRFCRERQSPSHDDIVLKPFDQGCGVCPGNPYAAIVDRKNMIKAHSDLVKIGKTLQDFQEMGEVRKEENIQY
jgi:hypothetical protein